GIDTRRLTRILRDKGALSGCIMTGADADAATAVDHARRFPGLSGMDLARIVSTRAPYQWSLGRDWPEARRMRPKNTRLYDVVAYDFGIKRSILRNLVEHDCRVTVVPAQTPVEEVLALQPDGVLLSNGPGDPEPCTYAVDAIRGLLDRHVPLLGICLGHQLLGLASGARTMKLKFGHHGANHPVLDIETGQVTITSQNHGF